MTGSDAALDRAEWVPEFPGQRPPFEKGNTASLRIGSHSPRVYEPRAQELAAGLIQARPDLDGPSFAAAVHVWAVYAARFELRAAAAADDAAEDYWIVRLGNALLKAGTALGLDPTSEARLTRDRAATAALASHVDLDALAQRGRAALDARAALAIHEHHDHDDRQDDQL
ncbi:MAG TPA: hypothetical protein VGM45_08785 [Gaiellaceae bacterium]|jgi:hypothetical protein